MDEADADAASEPAKASAWPLFVALGLAVSEVGVFMNGLYPVAVAGLLLFAVSVAGILHESGYVERPWRTTAVLGAAFVVGGAAVVLSQVGPSVDALAGAVDAGDGVVFRGFAIAAAGLVAGLAGLAGDAADYGGPFGANQ